MTKMKLTTILNIILVCLCSCSSSDIDDNVPTSENVVDMKGARVNSVPSSLVDSIAYIPLETTKLSRIGKINKIICKKDNYYVFDRYINKAVYAFDKGGRFMFKIARLGYGPGEYIEPLDFDVNDNGDILVWDNGSKKIIRYSQEGKKFDEINLPFRFFQFANLDNNKFAFYRLFDKGKMNNHVSVYDAASKSIKSYVSTRKVYDDLDLVQYSDINFYRSENDFFFYKRFSDKIYTLNAQGVSEAFSLKTDLLPTEEFIKRNKRNVERFLKDNKYIKDVTGIYKNDNHYIMSIHKAGTPISYLISKDFKKVFAFMPFDYDYPGLGDIRGTLGNAFVSVLYPGIPNKAKYLERIKKSSVAKASAVKLEELNENSNPVISLVTFKKI